MDYTSIKVNVAMLALLAAPLVDVTGYPVRLPGVFSDVFCQQHANDTQLAAVCSCFNHLYTDTSTQRLPSQLLYKEWCRPRARRDISDCMQQSIKTGDGYLGNVFDAATFNKRADFTCSLLNDIERDLDCISSDILGLQRCDHTFYQAITNVSDLQSSCRLSEDYSACYWTGITNCPAKVKHFYTELTDIFVTPKCTEFEQVDQNTKCSQLASLYHQGGQSEDKCFASVKTTRDCLERELPWSVHAGDQLQKLEFRYDWYQQLSELACTLASERDILCFDEKRRDFQGCYDVLIDSLKAKISNYTPNTHYNVTAVCSDYHALIACTQRTLRNCRNDAIYFNSMACAGMPQSCTCPDDVMRFISSESTALKESRLVLVAMVITVSLSAASV